MKKYPFKFLDAYGLDDTDIFFGRDEEIAALYEMLFQSSILLVYGASGTGKTSLIQCGLAGKFQSHDWLPITIRRGSDMMASFQKALADKGGNNSTDQEGMDWLEEVMDEKDETATPPLTPFAQSLKTIYLASFRPVYLIFDQFEELYILGSAQEQEQFIQTVKEILSVKQPVKMIFSIREEYLGHLNRFERAVPQLLRKKLRVEPMNLDKVRQVIVGATENKHSNVKLESGEKDKIADLIFDKIKGNEKTLTIQLPYLQVFLDKLYLQVTKDETRRQEAVLTAPALSEMGDIGDVLRNFLEEQVTSISKKLGTSDKNTSVETIWSILSPFATLEGTKEPVSKQDLYERLPDLSKELIDAAVKELTNSRILRYSEDVDLYEVAHDSLAKRISEKRSDEEIALLEIKRLIKQQTSLKANARELFSTKQMNFIEPSLHKIQLTAEEKKLIDDSHKAIVRKKRMTQVQIGGAIVGVLSVVVVWFIMKKNALIEKQNSEYVVTTISTIQATSMQDPTNALKKAHDALIKVDDRRIDSLATRIYKDTNNIFYRIISNPANEADSIKNYKDSLFISISKDGTKIFKAIAIDTIGIWDTSGTLLKKFYNNSGRITSADFSIDNGKVLTGSVNRVVQLRDMNGAVEKEFKESASPIKTTLLSPDGTNILTCSDSVAILTNLITNNSTRLSYDKSRISVNSAAFSSDGKQVMGGSKTGVVYIWDENGKQVRYFPKTEGAVTSVAFSPDNNKAAWGRLTRISSLRDLKDENAKNINFPHGDPICLVAFSPDGREIITSSTKSNSKLWDIWGNLKAEMRGPEQITSVLSVAFLRNNNVITVSSDHVVRLWYTNKSSISPNLHWTQFVRQYIR